MVPYLLSGASTWVGITCTKEERLDKIQEFLLQSHVQGTRILSKNCFASRNWNDGDETSDLTFQIIIIEENQRSGTKQSRVS